MDRARRLEEQKHREEQLRRQKEARWRHNNERSAQRKAKLAEKLDDNAMLIAAIAFYCRRLKPGERVPAAPIRAHHRKLSRKWQLHLKAARRILGIHFYRGNTYQLPHTFEWRLQGIGLNFSERPFERRTFQQLNSELMLDDALRSFAADHAVLERTKQILTGYQYVPLSPQLQPPDPVSSFLQAKLSWHLRNRMSR